MWVWSLAAVWLNPGTYHSLVVVCKFFGWLAGLVVWLWRGKLYPRPSLKSEDVWRSKWFDYQKLLADPKPDEIAWLWLEYNLRREFEARYRDCQAPPLGKRWKPQQHGENEDDAGTSIGGLDLRQGMPSPRKPRKLQKKKQ